MTRLSLRDRIRFFENDFGHRFGWIARKSDRPVASLSDAEYTGDGWWKLMSVVLTDDPSEIAILRGEPLEKGTVEFWNSLTFVNKEIAVKCQFRVTPGNGCVFLKGGPEGPYPGLLDNIALTMVRLWRGIVRVFVTVQRPSGT